MNFKPVGEKILVKADKIYKKEAGKPVVDSEGNPLYDLKNFTVYSSTFPELKKGKRLAVVIRGGVPIEEMETKKNYFLSVDLRDIYGVEI